MINFLQWRIEALEKENASFKEELNACLKQINTEL